MRAENSSADRGIDGNGSGSTVRADEASGGNGQTLRRWPSTSPPPPQGARECRRAHRRTTRVDSEGSIGGSFGGRGSAQKRCQPLVKGDGNCSEIPVKTW